MRSACATLRHADRREILEHLIFQLVAVDHQQDGRLLRLVRLEEQLGGLDHRVGLAAALRVPDQPARAFRVESARDNLVHRRRLMLAQDELLQLLLLLREEDEVLQETAADAARRRSSSPSLRDCRPLRASS